MKVLVTDMRHLSIEEEEKVLAPLGVKIDTTFSESEEDLIRNGKGAIAFLASYAEITRRVMESLPELKIISKYGVGVDNIDIEAATNLGIFVTNVPDYCVEEVALHTLSLILVGLRRVCYYGGEVKGKRWNVNIENENIKRLSLLSLGLLGFGRIARRLSLYMESLVKDIYFYDPFIKSYNRDLNNFYALRSIDELFKRAHIISIHIPLNENTERLVDERVLSEAQGIILVNSSRAEIVDRMAVMKSLESGEVLFFASDVFWEEPPNFKDMSQLKFLQRRDVLITPHIGWYSKESERLLRRSAAMEVARVIKGYKPKNLVNRDVLYHTRTGQ